ncbi:MAG TPA: GDSL-type esterase/lipase family protein [Oscillospiraceae bacterium]|nr:GDSL-type esterase/lipase family protein [Oscillospiraceae bacterium]
MAAKRGRWQVLNFTVLVLISLIILFYFSPGFKQELAVAQTEEIEPPLMPAGEPNQQSSAYDFHSAVPAAAGTIAEDYFQDAVFIGDSRTTGLQLFGGPTEAIYYTATGLKVDTISTKPVVASGKQKITIMEALDQHKFDKIYIMLGINELGWAYSDLFIKTYGEVIAELKKIAPAALIYVQSILPVTKKKSLQDNVYNQQNINKYNELIQQMAAEQQVYFLDAAAAVKDDEGYLPSAATTDGIHLNPAYCQLWFDYLQQYYLVGTTGGVVKDAS